MSTKATMVATTAIAAMANEAVRYGWRASQGARPHSSASASSSEGWTAPTVSTIAAGSASQRGSLTSAVSTAAPLMASRMRSVVPRLRRSGKAGGSPLCLIIDRMADGHASIMPDAKPPA